MVNTRITAYLSKDLFNRAEAYLKSPVSVAKNKTDLLEKALMEYLDREEVIAIEMEQVLMRIRKGLASD